MAKAILEFNLPEEQEEFEMAARASDYSIALWDIAQDIFRRARKYGYPPGKIQDALEKMNVVASDGRIDNAGEELIGLLEEEFYSILRDRKIEI